MARILLRNGFDLSRLNLGDFAIATVTATATSIRYQLGTDVLTLFGSFTLQQGVPQSGTIDRLTFTQGGAPRVNVTNAVIDFQDFETALSNDQIGDLFGSSDQVRGLGTADRLRGFDGNDSLTGLAGNDTLFGGRGDDTLDGGLNNDLMVGGEGNDVYRVNSMADVVFEVRNGGTDRVETTLSSYNLRINVEDLSYSGVGNFTGVGNVLDNQIIGNVGQDTLNGLSGDDTLRGGNGNDRLNGGEGDDSLVGDAGGVEVISTVSVEDPARPGNDIVLTLELPEISTTTTTTVQGYVGNAAVSSTDLNLAFVLDISGSMTGSFSGSTVGDQNGDGSSNTKIDAVIAAFAELVEQIEALGFGSTANIALIPFGSDADLRAFGTAIADLDNNSQSDLIDAAQMLRATGSTNYQAALQEAITYLDTFATGTNQVFFLSDGEPNGPAYDLELDILRDPNGLNASIRALGIEITNNGFNILDDLDDGILNNSAIRVDDPATLDAGLLAPQVDVASIAGLEILRNGVVVETLLPSDLIPTPFGLRYSVTVGGLSASRSDLIEARLILTDAAQTSVATGQQISVGTLSSNDVLVGGNGNDTLDGGAGIDTLNGGAGDDLYKIDSPTDRIIELFNNGTDTIETTVGYSLNRASTANIENLTLLGSTNIGGTGNALDNVITGNLANNMLRGLGGADTINGGAGFDTLLYDFATSAVNVSLSTGVGTGVVNGQTDQISNIEAVYGSDFNDTITGSSLDETFWGRGGDDIIDGRTGIDTLDFSRATSAVTVSLTLPGNSTGTGSSADGGEGNDSYRNMENVIGSDFDDMIADGGAFTFVANLFDGGLGDDTLRGDFGEDTLIGGAGDDLLDGGVDATMGVVQVDVADYSGAAAGISGNINGQITGAATGTDTLMEIERIVATRFRDNIVGSVRDDIIETGNGNDTLAGSAGNDTLNGGGGNDRMTGGGGDDVFIVDSANDTVIEFNNGGTDTVLTTANFRLTNPNVENLTVLGAVGVNALGNGLDNAILGGDGSDNLVGFGGNDTILGAAGDDTLRGGAGADSLDGGDGLDWASFADLANGVSGTLNRTSDATFLNTAGADTLRAIENIIATNSADAIVGDSNANHIIGRGGNDTLDGGSGNDTLTGDAGNDSLLGSFGEDVLSGGIGNDTLIGGSSNDTLDGGAGSDILDGGSGFDSVSYADLATGRIIADLNTGTVSITGGQGQDILTSIEAITGTDRSDQLIWDNSRGTTFTSFNLSGERGADVITTSNGSDTLDGGLGIDTLTGGSGNDTYVIDRAQDVINELVSGGTDTVISAVSFTLSPVLENLVLTGNAIRGTGNAVNNILVGNDRNNVLDGLGGRDTFTGGLGSDTMNAGFNDGQVDTFIFTSLDDSRVGASDLIRNFRAGEDDLDLRQVDLDPVTFGVQRFTWIADADFTGTAGQLRFTDNGTNTFVLGDVDGDTVADFRIELEGVMTLTTSDVFA